MRTKDAWKKPRLLGKFGKEKRGELSSIKYIVAQIGENKAGVPGPGSYGGSVVAKTYAPKWR